MWITQCLIQVGVVIVTIYFFGLMDAIFHLIQSRYISTRSYLMTEKNYAILNRTIDEFD